MKEFEIRGQEAEECLGLFSKGESVGDGKFIYAGFFYPFEEDYSKGLSTIFQKLLKKENIEEAKSEFSELIERTDYKPKETAKYYKGEVIWHKPRELFKEGRTGTFYRLSKDRKFAIRAGIISTTGQFDKRAGLTFLRVLCDPVDKMDKKRLWELRKTMVEIWKDMTENKQIEEHLAQVLKFESIVKEWTAESTMTTSDAVFKAFGYLAPFDFTVFESAVLLSKARLFEKRKTPQEIIDELKLEKKGTVYEDILEGLKEEGYGEEWLLELFKRACDPKFLRLMRTDWKEILKRLLKGERNDKVIGVFVRRNEEVDGYVSYGTFNIPEKEIEVFLFYEPSLEGRIQSFKNGFNKAMENFGPQSKRYTGDVSLKISKSFRIDKLISNFEKLKSMNYEDLKVEDSKDLLFSLLYFVARLRNFVEYSKKNKKPVGILILLDADVRKEGESYPFWDYFALAYDYFSLPVQTLNRETIDKFCNYASDKISGKDVQSIFKNLFISFMKDLKSVSFEFEGFEVPQKLTIYAFLEKPSGGFCYSRSRQDQKPERHYIYEVYKIEIENNSAKVELENKYIVFAKGIGFDVNKLRTWIEERVNKNTRFCFITAGKREESFMREVICNSALKDDIEKISLFVEYKELPVAYISSSASSDCFVIYTSDFEEVKKKLGIVSNESDTESAKHIAIKPADTSAGERFELPDGEQYYHSALQVFSTTGPGWERDETYKEKKSLFLLTLISLSQYESESYTTPYAKLGLWQRKKNIYLRLRRDGRIYTMGLSGVLYEILYMASQVPGKAEVEDT